MFAPLRVASAFAPRGIISVKRRAPLGHHGVVACPVMARGEVCSAAVWILQLPLGVSSAINNVLGCCFKFKVSSSKFQVQVYLKFLYLKSGWLIKLGL